MSDNLTLNKAKLINKRITADIVLRISGDKPILKSAKVRTDPARANETHNPKARNINPNADALRADVAIAGSIGSTQGDSKLKTPARKASGIDENSIIKTLCHQAQHV